ncbi:hypothetical protein J1614_005298 [Plenodomus biglobosus]|nr:hypothetical protein J1614_005298 [Plenodomus biglobosus]
MDNNAGTCWTHPQNVPVLFFSISAFRLTRSCSVASNSRPCLTHCSASSNLPISSRHLPLRHQPFALPTFFISTLASASTAPSAHSCCAMFACARLLNKLETSSLTRPDGSQCGRPSAISIARVYSLTAWLALPLRNSALPDSRSLLICAERFGLTGTGGGGVPVGVSTLRRPRCRALRASSSAVSALLSVLVEEMALVVGSISSGRRVKVSGDSMADMWVVD